MFSSIILPIIVAVCIGAVCIEAVLWFCRDTVQQSPPETHERCVIGRTQNGEEIVLSSQLVLQIARHVSPDGRHLLSLNNQAYGSGSLGGLQRRQLVCSACRMIQGPWLGMASQQASRQARRPLWCCGCSKDHPAVFFPFNQRHSDHDATRTCISRQGHIRICSHASLTWSDIKKVGCETLRLDCGRKGHSGHPALLEIGTALLADGEKMITVAFHTSWDLFQQTSIPGIWKLPSPRKISEITAQATASLCPHVSFNPQETWQMRLQPQDKGESCDTNPIKDTVSKHFFGQRVNNSESPFENLCPLCEITTTNDAPIIKSKSPLATHHNSCCQCGARYSWTWCSTRVFGRSLHSLKLKISRQFTASTPTDPQWLKNLEFEPGGATDPRGDNETEHLLWCNNELGTFLNWDAVAQWAHKWNGT